MLTNDPDRSSARLDGTLGRAADTSQAESATFPSEAESLLEHLNLGAKRAAAADPPGAAPTVPNYEIECELGKGGMGVVYKARHTALHHTVAVKMILASAHASPGEVARFVAEAEAIAAVKHPNVVQVYDLGEVGGCPYFVMEYVPGGNLSALLKAGGALPPRRAAELIEAVARGVQAAHDAGIVHRDLKPANILLAGDRGEGVGERAEPEATSLSPTPSPLSPLTPKVSDFGLAKRLSSDLTRTLAVLGTPAYMAPEQAGGKAKFVGPQADVYALGVILYECLTGTVPFEGADPWSLIRQVVEDAPQPPRERVPGVPRDLELICLKCLEKEPHHRYPTAAALADDLRRFLDGEAVSVRPIGPLTRLARWAKKHPAAAGLAAVCVLIALAAPALVVGVQGRLDRRTAVAAEAQQKEEAARRAEDAARRAEEEAKRLAEERELFGLQNTLRSRSAARPLGWATANRSDLPRAVALAREPVLEDLRSAAAVALLSDDLLPHEPCAKGLTAAVLAVHPKTGQIAAGEQKAWGDCRVVLIDPATGEPVQTLTFPTVPVKAGGTPLEMAQDGARALAFSPDGARLFVGTRSGRLVRFDLTPNRNKPAKVWNAAPVAFDQLAVSPDGKTVYGVARPEPGVLAWDADTGAARKPLVPPGGGALGFAVLPSGGLVAGDGQKLCRWDADGTLAHAAPVPGARQVAAAPGSMLLVGAGERLEVCDQAALESTDRFADPNLRRTAHEQSIKTIAVHPSGAYAATAAGDAERAVRVWELASGRLIGAVYPTGTGPVGLAWSADGGQLFATAGGHVARWRFVPAPARQFACVGASALDAAAPLPDGRIAALGAQFNKRRELLTGRAGGPATAEVVPDPDGPGRPGLSAAPAGLLAVSASAPGLRLWKPDAPPPAPEFAKSGVWCPRFGSDGRTLWAVCDGKWVRSLDPATRAPRGEWNNRLADLLTGMATLETLSAGHAVAAAAGRDGTVYLLDARCEPAGTFLSPADPVQCLAFAHDDSLVVAGTQKGRLRTIRPADRLELPAVTAHPTAVNAVALSRDGALLASGSQDRTVRLWKRTGDRFESLLTVSDLPSAVRDLQFDPADGRLLVLLANEHAVRVWDLNRLKAQLAELQLGW